MTQDEEIFDVKQSLSVLENLLKKRKKRKKRQIGGVCAFSSKTSDNNDSMTEQAHDKTLTSLIPVPAALITGPNGNSALEGENTHLE